MLISYDRFNVTNGTKASMCLHQPHFPIDSSPELKYHLRNPRWVQVRVINLLIDVSTLHHQLYRLMMQYHWRGKMMLSKRIKFHAIGSNASLRQVDLSIVT